MDTLIHSQDGSHTIASEKFGVTYHSKYGAIQETKTVFLDAGLAYAINTGNKRISILEMGFGTGLNALMTLNYKLDNIKIDYHTIEAYPIIKKQYEALNYPDVLCLSKSEKEEFYSMHEAISGNSIQIRNNFQFTKHLVKLEDFSSEQHFDVIYYDAFAPTSQEELWTEEMMQKMYELTAIDGCLVTYCAKGAFKRALKSAGFIVEALPGPIGKREMTRAIKKKNASDGES